MRPQEMTPAHHTGDFAELVCSNSLGSKELHNASGLLKEEMRRLGSLVIAVADRHGLPAGSALAVDRSSFSREITGALTRHPLVTIQQTEVTSLEGPEITVVATGPLTSDRLVRALVEITGSSQLHFFDAAAPIITLESINQDRVFMASRYERGSDYINCPLGEDDYRRFYQALVTAERHPLEGGIDHPNLFEGCMPIEEMAERGEQTLLYGPLKPVGLIDPRTGRRPYAVVQLRQDNREGTLYNMVGFQTRLKWGEQQRVFRLIPGLEQAEFARFGVMHRNTYINSPQLLNPDLTLKCHPHILLAGQLTGVEGYVESAACGLVAGLNALFLAQGKPTARFPGNTVIGALLQYITSGAVAKFQPMNSNFGLLPPLKERIRDKRKRNLALAERALQELQGFIANNLSQ
jgi:methylenetetrahydrofolate--tRNA-(uracil-5-)-methyltransferase